MAGQRPQVYSIAAHRGFADALVAGLVPRYGDGDIGLSRLTLLLPSARAARTVSEAFIRHFGETGAAGMLLPRMAVVGDLDLDETLGPLFDRLDLGEAIPPAMDPTFRWLRLAELIREERGKEAPRGSALLGSAFECGRVMDRLLVEEIGPEELVQDRVLDLLGDLAKHWIRNLKTFTAVQDRWLAELDDHGRVDAAERRNRLFRMIAQRWQDNPPAQPIVAAGVTSAAPALARLLRVVSELPRSAVILPDLDLSMSEDVWDELGAAGAPQAQPPLAHGDALTHPQYHLKLLLNRMGIARDEVQPWHRAGSGKGPPERSHAISSLFLPPRASRAWIDLPPEKRRLAGVRMVECANPEEEAQAVALLVREALEVPGKRIAVITPDRGLAGRVVQHLGRWHIQADDSAGRPLSQTAAGRLLLLLAEVASSDAAPVPLMALLEHPLVRFGEQREQWLAAVRAIELAARGPRPAAGLESLREIAAGADLRSWWDALEVVLEPLFESGQAPLADHLDRLAGTGEALCGEALWSREDGRALSRFIENLRQHAHTVGTVLDAADLPKALREAMDREAVRPPYGGHPRVAIYGLLESRMTRADLVICAGLNEGVWPAVPATDPVLAPAVLRALGVPGADFRIGLSAHDLAGALGAPEVVLSRALRDAAGPAIASRFWLRVQALLGDDLLPRYRDEHLVMLAREVDRGDKVAPHPRPNPVPTAQQRPRQISVTALDRLRSDPYQFYASKILALEELEPLDAESSAAWRGELAHAILEDWHKSDGDLMAHARSYLAKMHAHPLMRALWQPRLLKALEWIEGQIEAMPDRKPVAFEQWGEMEVLGVRVFGKADRLDALPDGKLAVVDYKTGHPPGDSQVAAGYALQLGTLGLIASQGGFEGVDGEPTAFEYWSLAKRKDGSGELGYIATPLKIGKKRGGVLPEEFLPETKIYLDDALNRWILGDEGFTARLNPDARVYSTYDQLMRLDEWIAEA